MSRNVGFGGRNQEAMMYIAKRLVTLRGEARKPIYLVAQAVGVSDTALSFWEQGQRSIGAVELFLLSRYYGVTMDSFFEEYSPAPYRRLSRPTPPPAPRIDNDPETVALRRRIIARREERARERALADGEDHDGR